MRFGIEDLAVISVLTFAKGFMLFLDVLFAALQASLDVYDTSVRC